MTQYNTYTHILTYRQTDRQPGRQTDRQPGSQTDRHAYIHTYIHTYIYIHTFTYIHTCIHTDIHTYIYRYTHIHTDIHTYRHTHIHTPDILQGRGANLQVVMKPLVAPKSGGTWKKGKAAYWEQLQARFT